MVRASMSRRTHGMVRASSYAAGFLFGLGLAFSGMTQPGKVIAFLDFAGAWDPSLALVMGGALMVFGPAYFLVAKRRPNPALCESFDVPTRTEITPTLLVGGAIFGAGWGLGGFCPGTAITSVPSASVQVLAFVPGVLFGILATWGMQKALSEGGDRGVPAADF